MATVLHKVLDGKLRIKHTDSSAFAQLVTISLPDSSLLFRSEQHAVRKADNLVFYG